MNLNREAKVAIANKVADIIKDGDSLTIDTRSPSAFIAQMLRYHDGASFDRSAFQVVQRARVDYCILSASMAHSEKGFLVHEQCEVDMAFAMMSSASHSIMAVDGSKFLAQELKPAFRQPDLKAGCILVTDVAPPAAFSSLHGHLDIRVAG